ncbi:MAG TPA: ELWxxDGT repeat protein [Thermoanaerobaculia bacterium]|nr:ELWxxDGT repeat protein [Thermoanaerobaculia bacterium]
MLLGQEDSLWKTDGTEAGTVLVKAIAPAEPNPDLPGHLPYALFGGRLLFSADDGTSGYELWATDGSEAGTVLVKDVEPGSSDSNPHGLVSLDDGILFAASDALHGSGLWKSDGTEAGTVLVKGLFASELTRISADILWLAGAPLKVYFTADDGTHERELWVHERTPAGTHLVADLLPGEGSSIPEQLWPVGTQLLFSAHTPDAGRELWITDGTAVGTRRFAHLAPGALPSTPQVFTASGGKVYFVATDAETGFELYAVPREQVDGSADFYTVPPCRLVDTRQSGGPLGLSTPRTFDAAGHCGIPATARALAVNVTTVSPTDAGTVTLYRAGTQSMNTISVYAAQGLSRAAGTTVQLGNGEISAVTVPDGLTTHLIVDVTGYFQ